MRNFFTELERRQCHRAAAFYATVAWLLVQVATQVFPFAVLFSWFYEWTPQGLQLESEIPANESITPHTGKKLDRWLIAILLRAVVLLLTDKVVLRPNENPAASAIREKSIALLAFSIT